MLPNTDILDVLKIALHIYVHIWHETHNVLQAINSLKNVDSTALLQFLHPILNMLLHLIGNGGETLQVKLNFFIFYALKNLCSPSPSKWPYIFPLAYDNLASPCYTGLLTVYAAISFRFIASGCCIQSHGQYPNQVCSLVNWLTDGYVIHVMHSS